MSLQEVKTLMVKSIDTVVLCRNDVNVITAKNKDPTSEESKTNKLCDQYDAYAGDIWPAEKSEKYPNFAHVQDGYRYDHQGTINSTNYISFYRSIKDGNPQLLFIKPPISPTINNNYFHELIQQIPLLYNSLQNTNILTKQLLHQVFLYLPFKFPIFIGCTSINRGGDWTQFTYPFTKSKSYIIDYIQKCGNTFDVMDCEYEVDFFLMKDDIQKYPGHRKKNACICYPYDKKTLERKFNKPILVCRGKGNKLNEFVSCNTVGGSFWMTWSSHKEQTNNQWIVDNINNLDFTDDQKKKVIERGRITARLGGSCGIKSRAYYQTHAIISGKYLPMVVVNVNCGQSLIRKIVDQ